MGETLSQLNYLAILVAAAANMVVSAIWYLKPVFGKAWMGHVGLTDEAIKEGASPMQFVIAFVGAAVLGLAIALISAKSGPPGLMHGLKVGALVGIAAAAGGVAPHMAFAGKKIGLTVIDGGHVIATSAVMGLIIGVWP